MRPATRYCLLGLLLLRIPCYSQGSAHVEQKREAQKPEDFRFDAQPREIAAGEAVVLSWSIKGATKVLLEEAPESAAGKRALHKLGEFEGSTGSLQVRPTENTTYVISCEGSTTYSCASLSVRVRVKRR